MHVMRSFLHIVVLVLLISLARVELVYCQSDMKETVSAKLSEYLSAIKHESLDVQKEECDFMIATCTDSLVRHHVALAIYEHYRDSKIMGAEGVAIHVFDKWFLSGKVHMDSEMEMLAAKVFAEFNRRSLIGETASELTMQTPQGETVTVFGGSDRNRKYRIIYFYDTDCAACKVQTILLRHMLEQEDFPVDVIAIYADDDHDAWMKYMKDNFETDIKNATITHLWDPELNSDFQRKYGVIQTPGMFLISPDKTIIGRRLDVPALKTMLNEIFEEKTLEYGSEESMSFFKGIFAEKPSSSKEVEELADYIAASTMGKGDTLMFRQMSGDMMYYLSLQREEPFKEGLDYLICEYILKRPDIWCTQDDSLKVIGFAEMLDDLLSRSRPGNRVADIKVPATVFTAKKTRQSELSLRRLGGKRNIILFYTEGCSVCKAEKAAAETLLLNDKSLKIIMINVDEVLSSSPSVASALFDSFDLSSLPFIIETDKKGYITRRYISLL